MNTFHYIIYALTSTSVFLSFLVFVIYSKNNFKKGAIYKGIAVLLFLLSLRFFTIHLYINHLISEYPQLLLINNLTSRIAMPILFFVVLFSVEPRKFKWYDSFHLILPVLFVVHFSNVFFGPVSFKLDLIREMDQRGYEIIWEKGVFDSFFLVSCIKYLTLYGYTFLIIVSLTKSSNLKKLPQHLLDFFKVAVVFLLVNLMPSLVSHLGLDIWNWASLIGAGSTVVAVFGFFLIPNFIYEKRENSQLLGNKAIDTGLTNVFYRGLTESGQTKNDQLFQEIEEYFKQEKPFLNPDLSLDQLERHFGISGRYLSEAIKKNTGLNFSNYVNQARLDYFTENLNSGDFLKNKTVDDIALELGFRSVNSFYLYFRKVKGCTPKEYLKKRAMTFSVM